MNQTSKIAFIVASLVLTSTVTSAQSLRVLASKGETLAKSKSQGEMILKSGKTIPDDAVIEMGKGSYLGLLYTNGKTFELKDAGKTSVGKILKQLKQQDNTTAGRYVNYLNSELYSSNSSANVSNNHKQYMSVTGSVERALSLSSSENVIVPHAPIYSDVFTIAPVTFFWKEMEGAEEYEIEFYHYSYDDVSVKFSSKEPKLLVDLNEVAKKVAKNKDKFRYKIRVKGDQSTESNEVFLRIIDQEKEKEVVASVSNFISNEKGEQNITNIDRLARAAMYEEHNLYLNAIQEYQFILESAPDIEDFHSYYHSFQGRIGMKEIK